MVQSKLLRGAISLAQAELVPLFETEHSPVSFATGVSLSVFSDRMNTSDALLVSSSTSDNRQMLPVDTEFL